MTCSAAKRMSVLRVFNRGRLPRGADRDSSQMLSGHSTLRQDCWPGPHMSKIPQSPHKSKPTECIDSS